MTGRDSVPVASSIARSIVIGVSVAAHEAIVAHDDGRVSFVEASSAEAAATEAATTFLMEASAPEASGFSRSRICTGYSEGG